MQFNYGGVRFQSPLTGGTIVVNASAGAKRSVLGSATDMRIERATFTEYGLEIVIDGRTLRIHDSKYTILEMGYAVYLLAEDE